MTEGLDAYSRCARGGQCPLCDLTGVGELTERVECGRLTEQPACKLVRTVSRRQSAGGLEQLRCGVLGAPARRSPRGQLELGGGRLVGVERASRSVASALLRI